MRRLPFAERPNWRQRCEEVGFTFHTIDGVYWDERHAYEFTLAQVEQLESATEDLHAKCMETVEWIIREGHYDPFHLSPLAIEFIEQSWRASRASIYGRFDFSWDGKRPPKMLEYNADTPTGLLEASVVQWHWLNDCVPNADQFNSIHEKLIKQWRLLAADKRVHFSALADHEEDIGNTVYMMDVAHQAGADVVYINVEDIGVDENAGQFIDLTEQPIANLFKLYPWEWMFREEFADFLARSDTTFFEPAWKVLLSSKAILPLLWQRYRSHENLLPASFRDDLGGSAVRKPLYSREGEGITLPHEHSKPSDEPAIYQQFMPLPKFDDSYTVIGSWIVGEQAAGIGIREDETLITKNTSRFVPHYFYD